MPKKELTEQEEKAVEKAHAKAIGVFRIDSAGKANLERVYSIEEHGEEFQKLAESRKEAILKKEGKQAELREVK
nr:hypothetical protein [uncultured bacterium]